MMHTTGYNAMMPMRTNLDSYRSLPNSPMPMDPRALSGPELGMAMNHARMGLDAPDYFHHPGSAPAPRYSGIMASSSSYPEYDSERYAGPCELGMGSPEMNHRINAANLAAQLANSQILHSAKYGKIYPHVCEDGRYPSDFNIPKTIESVKLLDSSQLDRIFQAYRLPVDVRSMSSSSLHAREGLSSTRIRQMKVMALLEYLGAWKIVEHERLKRTGW